MRLDGHVQSVAEHAFETFAHGFRVAAPEAEAVSLHGGHKRIDRAELGCGRLWASLTHFRPGMDKLTVLRAFHNDRESLLPVRRHGRRPRLVRRRFGDRLQRGSEIKPHFTVLTAIQPFALSSRIEAESPDQVDTLHDDNSDTKGIDNGG